MVSSRRPPPSGSKNAPSIRLVEQPRTAGDGQRLAIVRARLSPVFEASAASLALGEGITIPRRSSFATRAGRRNGPVGRRFRLRVYRRRARR